MDRYEIGKRIGEGTAGAVYRARDRVTGAEVALKVLKVHSEEERARFEREATVLKAFDHPGIVRIVDAGVAGEKPYIAMELLEGGTLHSLVKRRVKLALRQSLVIVLKLADALAYAHSRGVIHRDVKPANAFITRSSKIKLMDFGMARFTESGGSMTAVNSLLGTPDFIAPEIVDGARPTPACDQYALGMMAYVMISGVYPFAAKTPLATMLERCMNDAPPLASVVSDLPAGIDAVVMQALRRDPVERHPGVAALAAALRRVLPLAPETT